MTDMGAKPLSRLFLIALSLSSYRQYHREIRAALDRHWAASDANNFEEEHLI